MRHDSFILRHDSFILRHGGSWCEEGGLSVPSGSRDLWYWGTLHTFTTYTSRWYQGTLHTLSVWRQRGLSVWRGGGLSVPRYQGTCETEGLCTHSQHTRLFDTKAPFTHSRCEEKRDSRCEEKGVSLCLGVKGLVILRDPLHIHNIWVSLIPRDPSHTLGVTRCEEKGGSQCEEGGLSVPRYQGDVFVLNEASLNRNESCLHRNESCLQGPLIPRDPSHIQKIQVSLILRATWHSLGVKRKGALSVKRRGALFAKRRGALGGLVSGGGWYWGTLHTPFVTRYQTEGEREESENLVTRTHTCVTKFSSMGWLWLVGSIKL